jgi:hypothetical protein
MMVMVIVYREMGEVTSKRIKRKEQGGKSKGRKEGAVRGFGRVFALPGRSFCSWGDISPVFFSV